MRYVTQEQLHRVWRKAAGRIKKTTADIPDSIGHWTGGELVLDNLDDGQYQLKFAGDSEWLEGSANITVSEYVKSFNIALPGDCKYIYVYNAADEFTGRIRVKASVPVDEDALQIAVGAALEHAIESGELNGIQGPKGDTGAQGPQGEKGETGRTGPQGEAGNDGKDGKSAYEYAHDGGYEGTEIQFAAGLKKAASAVWQANVVEYGQNETIMSNTSFSFSSQFFTFATPIALTEGWKYVVTFGGMKYESVCHKGSDGQLYLGDEELLTAAGTGEYPFGISATVIAKEKADRENITVKIEAVKVTEYRKLPVDFLPDEIFNNNGTDEGDNGDTVLVAASADWAVNDESDAGYVKNRTHWKESKGIKGELLPLTTLNFTTLMTGINGVGSDNIKEGDKYKVTWNGVEYLCTAHKLLSDIILGNDILSSGEIDTGEPFAIGVMTATSSLVTKRSNSAETVTISIEGVYEEIYHHIDPRYIKNMYGEITDIGVILPTTTVILNDGEALIETVIDLEIGKQYTVTWNGVEYTCIGQDIADGTASLGVGLGAVGLMTGGENTGEPFIIGYAPGMGIKGLAVVSVDSTVTSATLTILGKVTTLRTIDKKYIGTEWLPEQVYEEEIFPDEIIQNTETESYYYIMDCSIFDELDTIIVYFDGKRYVTPKCNFSDEQYYYGNIYLTGIELTEEFENTGEPFMITEGGGALRIATGDYRPHTVAIFKESEELHYRRIPARYLPKKREKVRTVFTGRNGYLLDFDTSENVTYSEFFEAYENGDIEIRTSQGRHTPISVEMLNNVGSVVIYENKSFVTYTTSEE